MLVLTQRAVQALQTAEQLARQSGRHSVEPIHLLRALLARPDSMACRVLARLGVEPTAAERQLVAQAQASPLQPGDTSGAHPSQPTGEQPAGFVQENAEPRGPSPQARVGRLPFTPQAKGIVERAAGEAQALGHRYVGTEHLLLGILLAGGEAGQAVTNLGADASRVREALRELLEPGTGGPS